MSGTQSKIGFGITLSHSTTSGGSYTAIAEILELTPPAPSVDEVKVYRSDNTAAVVEKIPGWTEVGDCDMTITYTPANRAALEGYLGVPAFWKITYPTCGTQTVQGDIDAFGGFLKEIGKETPLKDAMKCKAKIAINGGVTYTAGS
jgi:hypothetical protein